MSKPRIIFDTSAINRLAQHPATAEALIAAFGHDYSVRVTGLSVDEIIATTSGELRERYINMCRRLFSIGEAMQPHQEILKDLIIAHDSGRPFDWTSTNILSNEYGLFLQGRIPLNDDDSSIQREWAIIRNQEFEMMRSAREHFDSVFRSGAESVPASAAEYIGRLQVPGGAFWLFGIGLYEKAANVRPSEALIREFISACPPFHALLVACFVGAFDRCIADLDENQGLAGRNDIFMSAYLPYCDQFITDDRGHRKCLATVAGLTSLPVNVRWYGEFRDSLLSAPN